VQLNNPFEDRVRAGMSALSPEQASRAVVLIARLKRSIEDRRRMDEAVRASLYRVLGEIVREQLAQAGGQPCP
jgi:hypothetical protein